MAEWPKAHAWPPPLAGSRFLHRRHIIDEAVKSEMRTMFYVYILRNSKSKYYTGMTSRPPEARLKEHNSNTNRWTKNKAPWDLIYVEVFETKKEAWLRERQIKKYKGGSAFKKLAWRGA